MKNKSFKSTSEQIIHLSIFSAAFPSSMLLCSRHCCMRGSNFRSFGHSSRPWHPSSKVLHPYIHFVKLAAIPGAWLSVCTLMIYLCRTGESTRNSWVVVPIHEARNWWYSARDMTEEAECWLLAERLAVINGRGFSGPPHYFGNNNDPERKTKNHNEFSRCRSGGLCLKCTQAEVTSCPFLECPRHGAEAVRSGAASGAAAVRLHGQA
jgi:hypothetical protein